MWYIQPWYTLTLTIIWGVVSGQRAVAGNLAGHDDDHRHLAVLLEAKGIRNMRRSTSAACIKQVRDERRWVHESYCCSRWSCLELLDLGFRSLIRFLRYIKMSPDRIRVSWAQIRVNIMLLNPPCPCAWAGGYAAVLTHEKESWKNKDDRYYCWTKWCGTNALYRSLAFLVKPGDRAGIMPIGRVLLTKLHLGLVLEVIIPGSFLSVPDCLQSEKLTWPQTNLTPCHRLYVVLSRLSTASKRGCGSFLFLSVRCVASTWLMAGGATTDLWPKAKPSATNVQPTMVPWSARSNKESLHRYLDACKWAISSSNVCSHK
jgi:hypothetical protein